MTHERLRAQAFDLIMETIEDESGGANAIYRNMIPGGREIRAAALGITQRRHRLTRSVSNGRGRGA